MRTAVFDLDLSDRLRVPRTSVDEPSVHGERSTRSRHLLVLNVLACALAGVVAAAVLTSAMGLWRADVVLSGSMRPGIPAGSVELFLPEPTTSVQVGQVVAFHPPHQSFVVTHRVVAVEDQHGVWITTKGDANRTTDPWGRVHVEGRTIWVVRAVVPGVGFVADWARSPWPRFAAALIAVVVAGSLLLRRIWRP